MDVKTKEPAKVINHPQTEVTPADVAISRHLQNMFATYGEQKVRNTLKELFSMEYKPTKGRRGRKSA